MLDKAYYQGGDKALGGVVTVTAEEPSYSEERSEDGFKFTLDAAAQKNGKAWVWLPSNTSGNNDFEGFKTGTVGVLSFTVDAYASIGFQVHLIDSDNRSQSTFWNSYTMQGVFKISAPDNNVVSVTGWGGQALKQITVTDSNKYTGAMDVTIGIELTAGSKVTFHYYIDGQYVTSVTDKFGIASGKIDGVAFLCETKIAGSGFVLDDIAFGYAQPYSGNPAPVKPED